MSAERPIDLKDKMTKADLILDQTEASLRQMIEAHKLDGSLMDENNHWDDSARKPRLHKGGLESYKFEKDHRRGDSEYFWPRRSIRWVGDDGLSYLLQIFPIDEKMEKFTLWSLVTQTPFGLSEAESSQRFTDINPSMPKESFDNVLEKNFQLLTQEGAKIKTLITSSPTHHHAGLEQE